MAGTPGTWKQERLAAVTADPGTGTIPTGYLIRNLTTGLVKRHAGSYAWDVVGAASAPAHSTLTYAASVVVDLNSDPYRTLTLTGNVTLTSSNRAGGRSVAVRIVGDSSSRTLTLGGGVEVDRRRQADGAGGQQGGRLEPHRLRPVRVRRDRRLRRGALMNLRHPAFVARLTPASGPSGPGTLLGEMKYTGYSLGQGVPNNTVVDGFATWCDWGLAHIVQSSPYGSGRAARFGNTYEVGGSNNSRWAIIALIPMWLRNNLPRIRYRAFMKTPNSAVFWGQTDSAYNGLFWWGNTSIRANGGNAVMNGLSIWTGGSPGTQRASLNYTFAPNTWYLFDFDVKLDPASGFVSATVSKADGSESATMTWNGATGTDGDANGYYSAWGARASVHSLSSSVGTSTDLNYFVTMGPVLVYEPAG